ncbi:putative Zn(II)2Cys6 transcription factor [Aspergillus karnatakaensis]|uniref:Zn(II)2Cys6 transcription factor n=1 Tax=Aspergillus karnatakaensis TaxID=1810916 RepID=UPI003CCE42F7
MDSSRPNLQFSPHRKKRAQVARACGSCRLRRIKCDNNIPCSNCLVNRTECVKRKESASLGLTLPQAHREIASLRQRVSELEAELRSRPEKKNTIQLTPTSRKSPSPDGLNGHTKASPLTRSWGGVHFCPARSPISLWLGPSSLYAYIQRLSAFISQKLDQEDVPHQMFPISACDNKLLDRPIARSDLSPTMTPPDSVYLSPLQEDFFLNYFWQMYHVSLCPILNEAQFKQHYQSLLVPGGKERRPSALVDIVVATCMQYHISTLPVSAQGHALIEGKDALVAGRWHFWRGQTLLSYELETPSISTLQCHLLCAFYLCGGSFHNMMDTAVGTAVRTAYILGLHEDPPPSMLEPEREMRRRLWWSVYLMDTRAGMKLGRPFTLNDTHTMPALPSDSLEAAATSGSSFVPVDEDTTWLSFSLHQTRLYQVIRTAYTSFFTADFHLQQNQTIWDDPTALQTGAECLSQHTQHLTTWRDSIPQALRLKRQNNGIPFSTDGTMITLEQFAPHWLQRQRVLLELTYHHVSLNLYRPMISFNARPPAGSRAEEFAMRCAAHAVSLTRITHGVMAHTALLEGWHEAFYCQWNAVMTLVGFVILYPCTSMGVDARDAISLAISVFDAFGAKFSVAVSAGRIVRGLCGKVDLLVGGHNTAQPGEGCFDKFEPMLFDGMSSSSSSNRESGNPELNLFDMAFDIDFWNKVDVLWPEETRPL